MRGFGLRAPGFGFASVMVACASSSGGASGAADAGDAGVTCLPGTMALGGSHAETPHGIYALSNTSLTSTGLSATLPAGGSVLLEWNGDATSGPVSVDGTLVLPVEGTPQSWCVSGASTVLVSGTRATLQLQLATGSDVVVEPDGTCKQVEDAGAQVPVSTEAATGCFALGS
jgi:hypothetical protein